MSGVWDFGGAYANTAGALLQQDQARQAFPGQLQHTQALTRALNAQAGLEEHQLQSVNDIARMAQGMSIGEGGEDQSTSILKLSTAALRAGDSTLASNLLERASQLRANEARITQYQSQAVKAQADRQIKMADWYGNAVGGVRSQEDLDRVNQLFEANFGERAPAMQYSPELVETLRNGSMKMADRIRLEHNQMTEARDAERDRSTERYRAAELEQKRVDEQGRNDRAAARRKEAGKDVGDPDPRELRAADVLLKSQGQSNGLSQDDRDTASYELASRARALRKMNPGLSASEAQQRALNQMVGEKYFSTKTTKTFGGFGPDKRQTVIGKPGTTPSKPLPVPTDRAKLVPNTYYGTKKGTLLYVGPNHWVQMEEGGAPAADEGDEGEEE